MTGPEQETNEARQEADAALDRASAILSRGVRIAKGWEKSRQDNNFRQMLRRLGQKVQENGT